MRRSLPWILLAASLVVNAFFLAGAVWGHHGMSWWRGERGAMDYVVDRLDLNAGQRSALESLHAGMAERRDEMREGRRSMRRELLAELTKESFDEERFLTLMDQRAAERRTMFLEIARGMHGFLRQLSPEQREKFIELADDRRFRRALIFGGGHRD